MISLSLQTGNQNKYIHHLIKLKLHLRFNATIGCGHLSDWPIFMSVLISCLQRNLNLTSLVRQPYEWHHMINPVKCVEHVE